MAPRQDDKKGLDPKGHGRKPSGRILKKNLTNQKNEKIADIEKKKEQLKRKKILFQELESLKEKDAKQQKQYEELKRELDSDGDTLMAYEEELATLSENIGEMESNLTTPTDFVFPASPRSPKTAAKPPIPTIIKTDTSQPAAAQEKAQEKQEKEREKAGEKEREKARERDREKAREKEREGETEKAQEAQQQTQAQAQEQKQEQKQEQEQEQEQKQEQKQEEEEEDLYDASEPGGEREDGEDHDPENLITPQQIRRQASNRPGTIVAYGKIGWGKYIAVQYGPRNAARNVLMPSSSFGDDAIDETIHEDWNDEKNIVGEKLPRQPQKLKRRNILAVQGVAWRIGAEQDLDSDTGLDVKCLHPTEKQSKRFPETRVRIKWRFERIENGVKQIVVKKTWSTRTVFRSVWGGSIVAADKVIHDAAATQEKRHLEWRLNQRASADRSPTPDPAIDAMLRNGSPGPAVVEKTQATLQPSSNNARRKSPPKSFKEMVNNFCDASGITPDELPSKDRMELFMRWESMGVA